MITPHAIAEQHGLRLASSLPPRLAQPIPVNDDDRVAVEALTARQHARTMPDHAETRERWSRDKQREFARMSPHALCLIATEGPLSVTVHRPDGAIVRYGHNRGVWPARISATGCWKDTLTGAWNKSPLFWTGVQLRFWLKDEFAERELEQSVASRLAAMAEEAGPIGVIEKGTGTIGEPSLSHGFVNLGSDFDLAHFEMEVVALAERLHLQCWDDEGLSLELDRRVARRMNEMRMR